MIQKIVNEVLDKLSQVFDPAAIGSLLASGIIDAIVILAVFFAFYLLWKLLYLGVQPVFQKSKLDETTTIFVNSLMKYTILMLGVVTALDSAGIKTSAVLASLGIVGLTIGFAARDSLSNLISGVIIFLDRPFVIGDLVEVDGQYGEVDRITLRSTRIITVDGKMLAVPNLDVVNKTVTSYTNFPHIRIDVEVTVAVDEDIERARKILLKVADQRNFMNDPAPRVVVQQLNDYNILLELQVWIENEREHIIERYELREAILNAFRESQVEMPFETIQLAPFELKKG